MHELAHANGPTEQCDWRQVNWTEVNRVVRNLRRRIFRATTDSFLDAEVVSERLEPCAVKVASTVLRGAGGRKATCLPGYCQCDELLSRKQLGGYDY